MWRNERQVAALFPDRAEAEATLQRLCDTAEISADRFGIVSPDGRLPPLAARAYSRRTFRSLVVSHLLLGLAGLTSGLLAIAVLGEQEAGLLASAGPVTYAIGGGLGAMAGLMLAGAISLRPDEGLLFSRLRDGLKRNQWAVFVRVRTAREYAQARAALAPYADQEFATW